MLLVMAVHLLPAQTLTYEVELLGMHVGDMVLKKWMDVQGVLRFSMNTSADVNYLFGRTTAGFDSDIRYKQGRIFFAQAKNIRDGKKGRTSLMRCMPEGCEVETDRAKSKIAVAPTWCIARLFFEEPVHQKTSEQYTRLVPQQNGSWPGLTNNETQRELFRIFFGSAFGYGSPPFAGSNPNL